MFKKEKCAEAEPISGFPSLVQGPFGDERNISN
jgi:hypothetical protein